MSIEVGARIPYVKAKMVIRGKMVEKDMKEIFEGRRVAIFGVPGAYTPTCSKSHLPSYVQRYDDIMDRGIEDVVCLAVNDAFVMQAWAKYIEAVNRLIFIADGSAELTKSLGFDMDMTSYGMGVRSKRFILLVDDGVVEIKKEEPSPGGCSQTSAEVFLESLRG